MLDFRPSVSALAQWMSTRVVNMRVDESGRRPDGSRRRGRCPGFVFVPGTPRFVDWEKAADWIQSLRLGEPRCVVCGCAVECGCEVLAGPELRVAQFHGDEPRTTAVPSSGTVRQLGLRVRGPETLKERWNVIAIPWMPTCSMRGLRVPMAARVLGLTGSWRFRPASAGPLVLARD